MREAKIVRKTNETDIKIAINLDGQGNYEIKTGVGFFDHMMELFSAHSGFDVKINCVGDIQVDYHHSVEDIAIALGDAIKEALNDKKGIKRFASLVLPMDGALVLCAMDISGRGYLNFDVEFPNDKVGDFDCELFKEFFLGLTRTSGITLHFKKLYGENSHHIAEAVFKAFARTLADAVSIDAKAKDKIPSTKGIL